MFSIDGPPNCTPAKYTRVETDGGTALVREFLDVWKERVGGDGGDMSEEEQVIELRRTAVEFRERFDGNPWVRGLMESF